MSSRLDSETNVRNIVLFNSKIQYTQPTNTQNSVTAKH